MARYLYQELASLVQARLNCIADTTVSGPGWFQKHDDRIEHLVKEHMPSGSGFDSGTTINLERSHASKLVFETSFHHMNDVGYYDGWTEHTVTVTLSFDGCNIRVSGRDRNDIKDYIHGEFSKSLETDLTDEITWERLTAKHGKAVSYTSRWKDDCTQEWYVLDSLGQAIGDPFSNWMDARRKAIEILDKLEVVK